MKQLYLTNTDNYTTYWNVAQILLLKPASLIPVYCTMKQLMTKLEVFFLAFTLVEGCEFNRGLRIRRKSAKPEARTLPKG